METESVSEVSRPYDMEAIEKKIIISGYGGSTQVQ